MVSSFSTSMESQVWGVGGQRWWSSGGILVTGIGERARFSWNGFWCFFLGAGLILLQASKKWMSTRNFVYSSQNLRFASGASEASYGRVKYFVTLSLCGESSYCKSYVYTDWNIIGLFTSFAWHLADSGRGGDHGEIYYGCKEPGGIGIGMVPIGNLAVWLDFVVF